MLESEEIVVFDEEAMLAVLVEGTRPQNHNVVTQAATC